MCIVGARENRAEGSCLTSDQVQSQHMCFRLPPPIKVIPECRALSTPKIGERSVGEETKFLNLSLDTTWPLSDVGVTLTLAGVTLAAKSCQGTPPTSVHQNKFLILYGPSNNTDNFVLVIHKDLFQSLFRTNLLIKTQRVSYMTLKNLVPSPHMWRKQQL